MRRMSFPGFATGVPFQAGRDHGGGENYGSNGS
jgi:hypothetical protein